MQVFSYLCRCLGVLSTLTGCVSHDVHCERHLQRINAPSIVVVQPQPQPQPQPQGAP